MLQPKSTALGCLTGQVMCYKSYAMLCDCEKLKEGDRT